MLINVILRVLPFYIREPLAIAVCLVLAGRTFYWFATAGDWAWGGLTLAFLVVAVVRGYFFRKEWRSRRVAKVGGVRPQV